MSSLQANVLFERAIANGWSNMDAVWAWCAALIGDFDELAFMAYYEPVQVPA